MQTILKIEGMSCQHCVRHVTEALEEIQGVNKVSVSLENNNATVEHEQNVAIEQLKNAVEEVGYDVIE